MRAALLALALLLVSPGTAGSQALPGAKLYLKNNTRQTLRCNLTADAAPPRALKLKPGREFSDTYARTVRLAVTCPAVRPAAFGPLKLGTHYSFLRIEGRTDLIEVSPDRP
ncbi:MAG: hypothetical protein EPO51_06030 [Phenylobacterium sp.]|uniref:hypothetical protein n=1 Tax=Phenylobacterium sp. TaxID=1871053 RepID=UPI00122B5BCE|nr:hypothetical protein [Phenylobacterium sp.]TAJ73192.1 MAG: hypothetical protein EPO51_06030 [Phenylobacterium sp.]